MCWWGGRTRARSARGKPPVRQVEHPARSRHREHATGPRREACARELASGFRWRSPSSPSSSHERRRRFVGEEAWCAVAAKAERSSACGGGGGERKCGAKAGPDSSEQALGASAKSFSEATMERARRAGRCAKEGEAYEGRRRPRSSPVAYMGGGGGEWDPPVRV